jgi:uncharacterized damage-inducible protein DinB
MPTISADLRYPIGTFERPDDISASQRDEFISIISKAPAELATAVQGLNSDQTNTPYRPGGWTVRQVVHHLPDSHMNSYIRFRLALTEDVPTIKPYDEAQWAELTDAKTAPIEYSIALLENLHLRWVLLLESLKSEDWKRAFRHPELGLMRLDQNLALYAWHSRHHVAQIASLRKRAGWQ